jgi:hypothetical protein
MLWVGFEHTISASERVKTVHASDRSATVTSTVNSSFIKLFKMFLEPKSLHNVKWDGKTMNVEMSR